MIAMSLVLSSLLGAVVAHPMHNHRRALEIVTVTSQVVMVEYITSTIWLDETSITPAIVTPTSSTPAPALVEPSTTPIVIPSSTAAPQPLIAPSSSTTPPSVVVESTPSPVAAPSPSSSAVSVAPAPSPSTPVSSGGTGDHSGDGTYYATGLGSCGITSNDSQMVAALGYKTMDLTLGANPNNNPTCGRKVRAFSATNTEGVVVTIVDTCAGCAGADDLDFSPAAFDLLGQEAQGRIPITWKWEN